MPTVEKRTTITLNDVGKSSQSAKEPVRELLTIQRNGEPLSEFEAEHWQDFLNELIPIGLSQLFFFDGEKGSGVGGRCLWPPFSC